MRHKDSAASQVSSERRHEATWASAVFSFLIDRPIPRRALYAISFCFLFLTGVIGLGRPRAGLLGGGEDFEYLFAAGKLWLMGQSPYDVDAYRLAHPQASGFAYPPVFAPFCILLGALPHPVAELFLQFVGLVCAGAIAFFCVELAKPPLEHKNRMMAITLLLMIFSPFTSHVIWMGQTSLIATALVTGMFVSHQRRRYALTGFLCALSLMKPQLSLLPTLWLMATYRPGKRFWVAFIVSGLLLVAPAVLVAGPSELVEQYLRSMQAYRSAEPQSLTWRHMVGLGSVGAALGITLPNLMPFGLLFAIVAWIRRSEFWNDAEVLALLTILAILFLFAHNYDLVALAPLAPALYVRAIGRPWVAALSLLSLLVLYFPQRLLVPFDLPILLRYREFLLIGYAAVFFAFIFRTQRQATAA